MSLDFPVSMMKGDMLSLVLRHSSWKESNTPGLEGAVTLIEDVPNMLEIVYSEMSRSLENRQLAWPFLC